MEYSAIRCALIEREFTRLNDKQREAVFTTEGPLLILAGAGSGKTTVLINRIASLIRFGCAFESEVAPDFAGEEELAELKAALRTDEPMTDRIAYLCSMKPVAPWNILAITFTNKAANEIKIRLERMLGSKANEIWASTFHSACVRILRRDIDRLGFDRSFTIYDDDEHLHVIKVTLREKNIDDNIFTPRAVANIISRAKDRLITPSRFAYENADDFRMKKAAEIYDAYQARLRESNALDFDDIILYTVMLLQQHEDVLEYYRNKFKYILVDEYQDTNHAQYMFTRLLADSHRNICVVGDDDQSIYRFRGATIENILKFENQYPSVKVIRLEQNYRSTKSVLNAANKVIENNLGRKGKTLWTENEEGEKISFYRGQSEQDEAQYIVSSILSGYARGFTPRDFAVLYRLNAQSNAIENAFKRNGIPYRIVGGMRFFDRAEVRDMLAYLHAVANHQDTLRIRRIINTPSRKISDMRVEEALRLSEENRLPLYEVLRTARSFPELERAGTAMESFAAMLEELRVLAETMPLDELYDLMLERTGYEAMLEKKADAESIVRLENVRELKSSIIEYTRTHDTPSLEGFLEEVALFTDIDRYDTSADAAVLMTLHSAKGLEFPVVFMCGMEENIFPSYRSVDSPEELEEERRLCYVGMTRAERKLHMTCAKSRTVFGKTGYNRMSRFLSEIPDEHIHRPAEESASERGYTPRRSLHIRRAPQKEEPVVIVGTPMARRPARNRSDAVVLYRVGDKVEHTAFGIGVVESLTPMGGDMLLTVNFEKTGQKRLMANSASKFMKRK
ncbi:MAG: UvrD-helicase domain-containing protein [Clostridiales bacterium]|nr:UvrD-helicase domain-containing protein [Clostridiales bacterium]